MEAAKIQQKTPSYELNKQLAELISAEITSTQVVLAAMGVETQDSDFSAALASCPNLEQDTAFPQVRRLIAGTLQRLAYDGYSLKPFCGTTTRCPDEMVREMVETSSHELAAMGAIGFPRYVRSGAAPRAEHP
jgi:hypothetical protein